MTIAPAALRHWPAPVSTVSPSGKRGVTSAARNCAHSASPISPVHGAEQRFVGYGHRMSIAVLGPGALDAKTAARLALVAAWT